MIGFLVFTLLPLLFAFGVSFARWDVISGFEGVAWVGLDNYAAILRDRNLHEAAGRTLFYVGGGVPLTLLLGLLLALALNTRIAGRAVLRTIFFIPFIANAVAISATWVLLYHPRFGPINAALRAIGVAEPPLWLASSTWALPALIVMAIWAHVGYDAVFYLAALQDLPKELIEAAKLDGAGRWAQFRYITLPLTTPVTFFLLVTGIISGSQSFGMINLMTQGGPGRATTVMSFSIYQNAFQLYRFGYAAAMSWVLVAGMLLLTALLWRLQRRLVHYE